MICPICNENIDDGIKYCTSCGAEIAAFAGVTPDKIIVNQTPEQQQEMGDDSVTQLIPENYMTAEGDDSVTQLLPENYMTAEGDDSVTQLIPENYMTAKGDDSATMLLDPLDGKMPDNKPQGFKLATPEQPAFVQQAYQPNMMMPGQMQYQQSMPVNNQTTKKSNLLPIIVIGGLVVLGLVALAIIFI